MRLPNCFRRTEPLDAQVAQCRPALFRVALMWCHNRSLAEDLTHDALTKALARQRQLKDADKLRPWLFGILANLWRDHLRRLTARPTDDIDAVDATWLMDPHTPEMAASQMQLVTRVRGAIAALPLGQREVLALVDLEGCSYAETAAILDVPTGTVMSRLSRARAGLRLSLAELAPNAWQANSEAALKRVK